MSRFQPRRSPDLLAVPEAQYHALFHAMDEGVCIIEVLFDAEGNAYDYYFVEVNPSFEQHTGLKDAAGKTARELVPDLESHWAEAYGDEVRTGETLRFVQGSGAMGRWFDVYAFRLGQANRVALVFRDVSERKQSETALQRSELQYRTLFDSIDEGFCIIEVLFDTAGVPNDYRFLEVNPAFGRQTGLANAVGKCMRDFAPDMEQHWFDAYGRVAMTGEAIRFENHAAALEHWYDVYAFRYGAAENRHVAVLFKDINERKWAEEALRVSEERERNIATHLQAALIPTLPSQLPGLELATHYQPALQESEVGGDFFDVFALNANCTALVLADLSGKGLAAAQQVATLRNMLRYALYSTDCPADAINSLNQTLIRHQLIPGFATLFAARYDHTNRTLTYVNCGQEPGLLWYGESGEIKELPPTGPVLGGFDGSVYTEDNLTLAVGDVLVLFTDGLTEAGPTRRQLLNVSGVTELLRENLQTRPGTMQNLVSNLITDVERKAKGGIRDDMTLLVGSIV